MSKAWTENASAAPVHAKRIMPSEVSRKETSPPLNGALALLFSVGTLLAVSTIFAKASLSAGWEPLALLQWSLFGAGIVQICALVWLKTSDGGNGDVVVPGVLSREVLLYVAISGMLFGIPNALAFAAAPHVGAGLVALSFAFPLVLTYGLTVMLGLEGVKLARLIGVGFGLIGAVLLAVAGRNLAPAAFIWILATLAVPVIISVGNVYRTLKWPKHATPAQLSAGMIVFGFLTLVISNSWFGIQVLPDAWTWQATGLLAAQIAIFAVQYGLYFKLQKLAGPVYLSQIGSVGAVVGLVLAYIVFNEIPDLSQIAAVLFVGLGIVFISNGRG